MRENGCIFLGKTTTPEFAWKCVTDSPLNGVTRNPWNPALTPGGSSGGAAVAALLGMGIWHAASDAAGSIRVPAAFCGVHGFKPTFGVVPNYPASAFSGLGHHGPIAREVSELAGMLSVMARPDARDATAAPPHLLDFAGSLDGGIGGAKIGYVRGAPAIDPEIAEVIDHALGVLESLGAAVEETTLEFGDAREQIESYWRVGCALIVNSVPSHLRFLLDPGLMQKCKQGRKVSATEFRAFELKRESLASDLSMMHGRFDLLVSSP
jgi:aspartyl-tRNA(Asn)/glutamyl-tRNA(Gln) amidotransferase subunit A